MWNYVMKSDAQEVSFLNFLKVLDCCSPFFFRNISDKDEELEIPRAADSHLTPSIFDNELVKWVTLLRIKRFSNLLANFVFPITMY